MIELEPGDNFTIGDLSEVYEVYELEYTANQNKPGPLYRLETKCGLIINVKSELFKHIKRVKKKRVETRDMWILSLELNNFLDGIQTQIHTEKYSPMHKSVEVTISWEE